MAFDQQALLDLIADAEPVDKACAAVGIKPPTMYAVIAKDQAFSDAYRAARLAASHRLADKIQELGQMAKDEPEKAQAVRVAADIWKWIAAKQNPREYGERIEQHVVEERKLGAEEIKQRIADLQTELQSVGAAQGPEQATALGAEQGYGRGTSQGAAQASTGTRALPTGDMTPAVLRDYDASPLH